MSRPRWPDSISSLMKLMQQTHGVYGGAIDQKFTESIYGGAEYTYRDLDVPFIDLEITPDLKTVNWDEKICPRLPFLDTP